MCKIGLISERKFRKDEADDRCCLHKIHEHVPQDVQHPGLRARHLPRARHPPTHALAADACSHEMQSRVVDKERKAESE